MARPWGQLVAMRPVSPHELASRSRLRWAIGSLDGLRSSAWILSGHKKGDIYVAVRSLGGITKASFHKDGRCHVGFTHEYQATASQRFGGISRHWQRWRLPAAPIVRVLQIVVPHAELRAFVDRGPREVTWLPIPPEGSIAVVSIYVSAPDIELPFPSGAHGKARHDRLCWLTQKRAEKWSCIQHLKVSEIESMSLVTLTTRALEIEHRELPNRVCVGPVWRSAT